MVYEYNQRQNQIYLYCKYYVCVYLHYYLTKIQINTNKLILISVADLITHMKAEYDQHNQPKQGHNLQN